MSFPQARRLHRDFVRPCDCAYGNNPICWADIGHPFGAGQSTDRQREMSVNRMILALGALGALAAAEERRPVKCIENSPGASRGGGLLHPRNEAFGNVNHRANVLAHRSLRFTASRNNGRWS